MKPVLLMKFPFSSRFGGGEYHTIMLCQAFAARRASFYFFGSCRVLLSAFRSRGWRSRRFHVGKEPVSALAVLLFPFTAVFGTFVFFVTLAWYRFGRGVRSVYCLSLTEKILATPIARMFGMRVLWAEHLTFGRWMRQNPLRYAFALWSRFATVLALSNTVQEELLQIGVPERAIAVIPPGVDVSRYATAKRRTFHWTKHFVVGTVARLEREKGIEYLLRAFRDFVLSVPQARLVVVGDGPERKKLIWLAKQLGIERSVQWAGFQEDVSGWIQAFDCFVLPSVLRESFGIVLAEALASSCPVIASNLGGIPEIIVNNRTGILVEPGDATMLLRALLFCYQHPDIAQQLGQQGRRRVEERYALPLIEERLCALFP